MIDSALRIKDKTFIITGPFTSIEQAITTALTEHGADVAAIGETNPMAERFCRNIMDQREVNARYGRAVYISAQTQCDKTAEDNLSKAAEAFGSVDGLIDTHLLHLSGKYNEDLNESETQGWLDAIKNMQLNTNAYLKFIEGRQKGNCVVLYHMLDNKKFSALPQKLKIADHMQELTSQVSHTTSAINALAVGCSEEFLLKKVSENSTVQQAIEAIKKDHPKAKIIDNQQIANAVTFFSSSLCLGISGQDININHGSIIEATK